jgi:hypothetical protein
MNLSYLLLAMSPLDSMPSCTSITTTAAGATAAHGEGGGIVAVSDRMVLMGRPPPPPPLLRVFVYTALDPIVRHTPLNRNAPAVAVGLKMAGCHAERKMYDCGLHRSFGWMDGWIGR